MGCTPNQEERDGSSWAGAPSAKNWCPGSVRNRTDGEFEETEKFEVTGRGEGPMRAGGEAPGRERQVGKTAGQDLSEIELMVSLKKQKSLK
jgi:hypothetical protein